MLRYVSGGQQPQSFLRKISGRGAVWLAHLLWEQGVGGSNPLAPIFSASAEKIEQESCRKERGEQRRHEATDAASRQALLRSPFYSLLSCQETAPLTFAFEKLLVYQKAIGFADAICTLTRGLPRGYFFLADQLNRAALSIAANIAEGNGRFTKPDRRNFFGIARGSVQECVPLLELAVRQKLLKREQHEQLKADLEEVARMLSGLIKGLENRKT